MIGSSFFSLWLWRLDRYLRLCQNFKRNLRPFMDIKRIIGWFLVIAGILIIAWVLYASFQIFTAQKNPPQIFTFKTPNAQKSASEPKNVQELTQEAVSSVLQEQLKQILPMDSSIKFFNLTAWSIFAGLVLIGGGQIAGIGTKLLK